MKSRMGRAIALALLVGCTVATAARAASVHPGFEVGGRLGRFVEDPELLSTELRPAWSAAGFVEWRADEHWALVSGLGYEEVGAVSTVSFYQNGNLVAQGTVHQALGYLTVPLTARWQPDPGRGFFLRFGPEVGYLERVFGTSKLVALPIMSPPKVPAALAPAAQIFEVVSTVNSRDPYYPWAVFLDVGAGWEFPALGHRLHLRARWVEGLTDVLREPDLDRRTRALELAGGWTW